MSDRRAGFERMFRAHQQAVYRYALRRVDAAVVPDVVSETFLSAWRRFDDLAGDPLPWLLGIARRVCANQLRGERRRTALHERVAHESVVPADDAAVDPAFLDALAALSDGDREALMLVAWEGLGNREAAVVVGCTPAAFAVRVHRARRRLARLLGRAPQTTPAEFTSEVEGGDAGCLVRH